MSGADSKAAGGALKEAAVAALITLALCTPIIMFRTDSDVNTGQLELTWRPLAVLIFMALAFFGRLAMLTWGLRPARAKAAPRVGAPTGVAAFFSYVIGPIGLIFLFVYPAVVVWYLGPGGALKWVDSYGIQILIYVMLGWGLNIVVGLAGLLDLGYVAFYAVGAYAYTLLAINFGLSFWICLPIAGILAACWGMILGFPVLRLRGDYLAIVTLAFGEIIRTILVNWTAFSGGTAGISSIPKITFFGLRFADVDDGFDAYFGMDYSPIHGKLFLYYVILGLALITNLASLRLRRLPIGRAWEALREDEIACRSLGINTTNTKLTAFALGAFFGGLAGSFFAVRQGFISPESFTFNESATILAIVVLGGMGSQIGVALAAITLIGGFEMLRELDFIHSLWFDLEIGVGFVVFMAAGLLSHRWLTAALAGLLALLLAHIVLAQGLANVFQVYAPPVYAMQQSVVAFLNAQLPWLYNYQLDFDPTQYRGLIFGFAMVVMMVVRPRGFVSTRSPSIYLTRRTAVAGDLVKEGHG
jgi:branched-chain amino acid transport system permease protein